MLPACRTVVWLSGLRWAIEQCFETSRAALLRVDCRVNVCG